MHRRTLLALPLAAIPRLAQAQSPGPAELARLQAYLDSIRSLHARFLQVAPDGQTAEGQVWLERPGRMRFQYDPPSPFLLVAGHGLLVFHDSQLQQTSNIPIGSTPLGILLADHVTFAGATTVTGFDRLPGQLQLSLVRTASPQDGTLTLIFADPPLTLRQWIVTDAQRRRTTVTLYNVELGGHFPDKLFTYIDPRFFNGGGAG